MASGHKDEKQTSTGKQPYIRGREPRGLLSPRLSALRMLTSIISFFCSLAIWFKHNEQSGAAMRTRCISSRPVQNLNKKISLSSKVNEETHILLKRNSFFSSLPTCIFIWNLSTHFINLCSGNGYSWESWHRPNMSRRRNNQVHKNPKIYLIYALWSESLTSLHWKARHSQ